MIKKHGLAFIVIRALARQLQRQADFLFRLIGEEERLMPAQVRISGSLAAHEQPLLSHATPEEPPVDWLEQTEASDTPPADWLARVQQGQSQGQALALHTGEQRLSQRPALALHTGDRGGKLPFCQSQIFSGTDDMSHASIASTSSLYQIKNADDVAHPAVKAISSFVRVPDACETPYLAIEPAPSLAQIKSAYDISHTPIPSTSFLQFHRPFEAEGSTVLGASHLDHPNGEPEASSGSMTATVTASGFLTVPNFSTDSAPTTHQESIPMKITSRRAWSAIRQPFTLAAQATQGVNNQHLAPALEYKRLHRPANVPTSEPGTSVASVLPLLSTIVQSNHTSLPNAVASGNSYGPLADTLPDTYFLEHAPTHPQTSWPYLGQASSVLHPNGEPELASGTISPDYWPPLPPEPTHYPNGEPELASGFAPASGSIPSGFATPGSTFSSSTAWAHRSRLTHEQRGGTWNA